MIYFCCEERRRNAAREHPALNGIDFLEVSANQRTLEVHCVKSLRPAPPGRWTKDNVRITGGERIPTVTVTGVSIGTGAASNVLRVTVAEPGDFSTYTLRLVRSVTDDDPPDNFDAILSAIEFSFKIDCETEFDCLTPRVCPEEQAEEAHIDYLARDYNSFRQLIFDRMTLLMPQWTERNPADTGVVLAELLAYVGDYLAYQQDAAATEAYLGTARRRVSVRRHARLTDYFMHDGCNARAWVQIHVNADLTLPQGTQILSRVPGFESRIAPNTRDYDLILNALPEGFETMHDALLFAAHNEFEFYTWGDQECCLPKGATSAALRGHFPDMKAGDILVFQEAVGPLTGQAEDADLKRRHAVRLTSVMPTEDALFPDSDTGLPTLVTEIAWAFEDALPFALCLSGFTDTEHGRQYQDSVSVALGNIVLTDHGLTREDEDLEKVPQPRLFRVPKPGDDRCEETLPEPIAPRFRPHLPRKPLTHAATINKTVTVAGRRLRLAFDPEAPAASALQWDMEDVRPVIALNDGLWLPQRDLLNSDADTRDFAVEIEADETAYIRFGDDQFGLRPASGTAFTADYRVGNGAAGNVGAGALYHVVSGDSGVDYAFNPMPAQGGADAESMERARQNAPAAFRTQMRAVTPDDYARVAERHPQVQRAAATFRWTGSWRTVFLTVDRLGGLPVDADFEEELRDFLERFRMAGHDLEIEAPQFVSIEIDLLVCVHPDYFRSDVKAALLQEFSAGILPDGRRGFFHPDNFTFGQPVYLSRVYAVAQSVAGVASVQVTQFRRQGGDSAQPLRDGLIAIGSLEVARLDSDPNFPEHGLLRLDMQGGK